ncbi:MAG TPA: hypothetical protein DDZ51_26190 [Planctomycetaceae bacterium]|nr:hypothetical protein [Planctomycetaceae bacterium]
MNLAAGSNRNPASKLAITRRPFSGLVMVLLAIFLSGYLCASRHADRALVTENAPIVCDADRDDIRDGASSPRGGCRYETELSGFAEIDAPGRKTSSARVFKKQRDDGNPALVDHKACCGLSRNPLILKSLLALPMANCRPSLQDIQVRLQV